MARTTALYDALKRKLGAKQYVRVYNGPVEETYRVEKSGLDGINLEIVGEDRVSYIAFPKVTHVKVRGSRAVDKPLGRDEAIRLTLRINGGMVVTS